MNKKKALKIFIPVGTISLIFISCLGYMSYYMKAKDVDTYLKSSTTVKVSKEKKNIFFDGPGNDNLLVFYPGAQVDEKAYAPLCYSLSLIGLDTVIVKQPMHWAFFGVNKADIVFEEHKGYNNYFIGGHSLGGAMSAEYVYKTNNDIKGLIFFAAYSAKDLKNKEDLNVLSIYGDKDGVIKMKNVEKGREYMPNSYTEVVIKGGNHAQFGRYGKQNGDHNATISEEEQLSRTIATIGNWMTNI